jgi:hypothetical protein
MKCAFKECDQDATHYPQICQQAVVFEKHKAIQFLQNPLRIIVGLATCLKHAKGFSVEEFLDNLTPNGQGTNREFLTQLTKQRPLDFKTLYNRPISMNDDDAAGRFSKPQELREPNQPVSPPG